jgi:hypothetical protein
MILHTVPNTGRTFTIVSPAKISGWPKREPDYADFLVKWLRPNSSL